MRIAFIGQKGIPTVAGGVEKHVEEVATRMAKMGHEVFVYVRNNYTDRNLSEFHGVKLIHLPSISSKNLDAISHTFLATIHALFCTYDVIHYQAIGPTSLAWIPKLLKRKTVVVATFHCQDYYHQKWGKFAQAYLKFGEWVAAHVPDKTITVSHILKDYVAKKYGCEAMYIPNGAGVQQTEKTDALKQWDLTEGRYILIVSRLIRHKGVHYAIETFKQLQDTSRMPNNFKLVIVGDGFYTDEYVGYLKRISEKRPNIVFAGSQGGETLAQLFSHAYLFVQPSESEGLSLSLLESMGCGVAPLVSDIDENMEAIQGCGFSFRSKDVQDLKEKMAYLLNRPNEVISVGRAAKVLAEREYSWESIARKTLGVYEDAVALKHELNTYVWKSKKA